jgi:hypothetical protein
MPEARAPGRMKLWKSDVQPRSSTARLALTSPSATHANVTQETTAGASAWLTSSRSAHMPDTAPPSEWPALRLMGVECEHKSMYAKQGAKCDEGSQEGDHVCVPRHAAAHVSRASPCSQGSQRTARVIVPEQLMRHDGTALTRPSADAHRRRRGSCSGRALG